LYVISAYEDTEPESFSSTLAIEFAATPLTARANHHVLEEGCTVTVTRAEPGAAVGGAVAVWLGVEAAVGAGVVGDAACVGAAAWVGEAGAACVGADWVAEADDEDAP